MELDIRKLQQAAAGGDPQARYMLAMHCMRQNDMPRAEQLLLGAAQSGMRPALECLTINYLDGVFGRRDPHRATQILDALAAAGNADAHYFLACLRFSGQGGIAIDQRGAHRHLVEAARRYSPHAWRAIALMLLNSAEPHEIAVSALRLAADRGDIFSQHAMGVVLHESQPRVAKYWLTRAADAGFICSQRELAQHQDVEASVPEATSAAPDIDSRLEALLAAPGRQAKYEVERRSIEPDIRYVRGLLSALECDYVIFLAAPYMRPSRVVDPATGQALRNPLRTSSSTNLGIFVKDIPLCLIERRWAECGELPVSRAEPLAVLRYQAGEEYRPHYDFFTAEALQAPELQRSGGQRVLTIFSYLNDVLQGGGTDFPHRGFTVQPRKGDAVVMRNVTAGGQPDPETLHAGLPVEQGEKWLATLWFREKPGHLEY